MAGKVAWRRQGSRPVPASGIAVILVFLLVGVGAVAIQHRQSSGLRFAHSLPAYHQLVGDDIRSSPGTSEASVLDRYTTESVNEGAAIQKGGLGPAIPTHSLEGEVIIVLPSLSKMATVAQPGDLFRLQTLGSSTRICAVRVLAVESDKNGPARVIAALPHAEANALNAVRDPDLLIALRVWGYAEGATEPSDVGRCK